VPQAVGHGESFPVEAPQGAQIKRVSLVSLASVTHSFDEHQRIVFPPFATSPTGVSVTVPASVNVCPPGHYMLFLVTAQGVPSLASIVQVRPTPAVALVSDDGDAISEMAARTTESEASPAAELAFAGAVDTSVGVGVPSVVEGRRRTYLQVYAREAEVTSTAKGTRVTVGITGTCPYGIGACWGGAYEALNRLAEVDLVAPIPNADDSTAEVYLRDDGLPPIVTWNEQFRRIVNGTYELRGVEVTLRGSVNARGGELFLVRAGQRSRVRLVPITPGDKLQWNHAERMRKALESDEAGAHAKVLDAHQGGLGNRVVTITGPLTEPADPHAYDLHVRIFVG
jgi:hypothetical protein